MSSPYRPSMSADLAALLARRLDMPSNEADRALAMWVAQLKAAAREHGQVEVPELGTFTMSAEGTFGFKTAEALHAAINSVMGGLEPIEVNPSDPEHPYGADDGFVFEEMQVPQATDTPKPRLETNLTDDYWAPPDEEDMFAPLGPPPPSMFEEADFQVVRDEERFFGLADTPEPAEEPAPSETEDEESSVAPIESHVAEAAPWTAPVEPPIEPASEFAPPPSQAVESFEDALAELETTIQSTAPAEPTPVPEQPVVEDVTPAAPVAPPPPTLRVPEGFKAERRAPRRRYEPDPEPDRRKFILIGGAVLVVVLVAVLAWWFTRPTPPPPVAQQTPPAITPVDTSATAASDSLANAAPDSVLSPTTASTPSVPVGANPNLYGTVPIEKGGYGIVVASAESEGQAERLARPFVALGYRTGIAYGSHQGVTRHRVMLGQFGTANQAVRALGAERDKLPEGSWVMRLRTQMNLTNLSL
ncbi:MAG: hypothetical protein RhofKO_03520 [Rhodothermales bacterium]